MGAFGTSIEVCQVRARSKDTNLRLCLRSYSFSFTTPPYPRRQPVVHIVFIRSAYESNELWIGQRRNVTTCEPEIIKQSDEYSDFDDLSRTMVPVLPAF